MTETEKRKWNPNLGRPKVMRTSQPLHVIRLMGEKKDEDTAVSGRFKFTSNFTFAQQALVTVTSSTSEPCDRTVMPAPLLPWRRLTPAVGCAHSMLAMLSVPRKKKKKLLMWPRNSSSQKPETEFIR
ncbi:hypothetical protein PBY51_016884 [Eleginops maclovinus]|nr:hypothetical protein PBY51_016884 [Eleginops maclovinus]